MCKTGCRYTTSELDNISGNIVQYDAIHAQKYRTYFNDVEHSLRISENVIGQTTRLPPVIHHIHPASNTPDDLNTSGIES